MASIEKLDRWLDQIEDLLNDGTLEYGELDDALHQATLMIAKIRWAKQNRTLDNRAPSSLDTSRSFLFCSCHAANEKMRSPL